MLGALGGACYRHRRLTVLVWLLATAALIALWIQLGASSVSQFSSGDPGQRILNQHFPKQSGDQLTLAIRSAALVTSPDVKERVTAALASFRRADHVTQVGDPYTAPGQISRDGHIAYASIQFDVPSAKIPGSETKSLIDAARAGSGNGVTLSLGGDVVDQEETPAGGPTQAVGVLAAAIVLLLAFGSLLAMTLPIMTALFGVGTGLALAAQIGHLLPYPSFGPVIASLVGLGVGVDYALFVVTRFREGLRAGLRPEDAAVMAMRTAGRSVLVAGSTVIIGLLGLLVVQQKLISGVAVAAICPVAMTMLSALTVLPAMLGFTGTRLANPSRLAGLFSRRRPDAVSSPDENAPSAARRWAGVIQRHPGLSAVLSAAVILALAAPLLKIQLNQPDESSQARDTMGYASYRTMADGFGPGAGAPFIVAAKLPSASADVGALATALRGTPGVARVTPPFISSDGQAAMLIAFPTTRGQDAATNALVNRLRSSTIPHATAGTGVRAYLTGPNAANVDLANALSARLPWLIAAVVVLAMLLLLAVFRSLTIAITAAVMNLISVSAAYGVLVAVSQWGWGRVVFGFPATIPVTTWVPTVLFVILFGLSMDYQVFLLSRIREAYDRTGDNTVAVADGLASTARVISAAAAIMIVVFCSVLLQAYLPVKQVGLGLAVAVLIDATLVRLALVPAVMELLGKANWWAPRWLLRLLPRASHADVLTLAAPGALQAANRQP